MEDTALSVLCIAFPVARNKKVGKSLGPIVTKIRALSSPLTRCETLGKSFNLRVPFQNGGSFHE